jgi:hypothetical protein
MISEKAVKVEQKVSSKKHTKSHKHIHNSEITVETQKYSRDKNTLKKTHPLERKILSNRVSKTRSQNSFNLSELLPQRFPLGPTFFTQ